MTSLRPIVVSIGVLIALVSVFATLALTVDTISEPRLIGDIRTTVQVVDVSTRQSTDEVGATIQIEVIERATVVGFRPGVVTAVLIAAGDLVESGSIVATIDDSPIIAFTSSAPLWRDLGTGARGPDVKRLQMFLRTLAYTSSEPDGVFGRETADAVASFNEDFGLGDRPIMTKSNLAWVLDTSDSALQISSIVVRVGQTVAEGDAIAEGPPTEARASAILPPNFRFDTRTEWFVDFAGVEYPVPFDGILDPVTSVAIARDSAGRNEVSAVVRRSEQLTEHIIPATAVLSSDAGSCVFRQDGEQWIPVTIRVIESSFGAASVEAVDGELPDEVLVDVAAIPTRTCESGPGPTG